MRHHKIHPARAVLRLIAIVAAVSAVGASSASAAGTLQPGALVESDTGSCTLNFAYTSGANVYLGTAAHCVDAPGQAVRDGDGDEFGTVALMGDPDSNADDYAFIEVDAADRARVSPQVKGSPQYPTGVTTPAQTQTGDTLALSGYGTGFSLLALTRERRAGVLISDDANEYRTVAPLIFGDSGGPIVHARTGRALGIVSRLCVGLCTEEGPTVQGTLTKAAARGLPLRLMTR